MSKNLVIVESPAKAKTIEKYLGEGFTVRSSYGHVRDLPKKGLAIDVKDNFKPTYEVAPDKLALIGELSKLARQADIIWLATDDDREGEAISWHLKEALGLRESNIKRIVFREITKTAILKAVENPRKIDLDLVNAQQARRILDRLVGFELSPILWKKVQAGLSAGRVQSVAVRLVVDREREIENFKTTSAFVVKALFDLENNRVLEAELPRKIAIQGDAMQFLEKCKEAIFSIKNLEKKPAKRSPSPPFTTSTLQQQASVKLHFSVSQTMTLAQKLYEAGHISYMRTDSVNLSQEAISGAVNQITNEFGKEYVQTRQYKTKSESAQEAHEAIRPTNFAVREAGGDSGERRLYELIWKRAIASQMADAQLEKTVATVDISTTKEDLIATGEVIKFDGFLRVYTETSIDEDDEDVKGMLPPLQIGQILNLNNMSATERFTRPNARFTEATLVKQLEEMGIGRPSTYAPTISTIQKRGYILKDAKDGKQRQYQRLVLRNKQIKVETLTEIYGAEKAKLFPTNLAMVTNDFLVEHFGKIVDYSFTAKVEKEFDEIAHGKMKWEKMLQLFYGDFHKTVEDTVQHGERANSARVLGIDPKTSKEVTVRLGRYGALAQIGVANEETGETPQYANLLKGQFLETITLEEALDLFKLPREVGFYKEKPILASIGRYGAYLKYNEEFISLGKEHDPLLIDSETAIKLLSARDALGEFEGKSMSAGTGRFGAYIKHDGKFYSLPKGITINDLTNSKAIEIILAKRKTEAEKLIKEFSERPEIKILKGRWGAYIAVGKDAFKLPKEWKDNPEDLTLADCLKITGIGDKKTEPKTESKPTEKKAPAKKASTAKTAEKKTPAKKTTDKKKK